MFLEQPPWKRLVIAFAGPAANLIFPGLIYFALMVGQNGEPTAGPVVGTVAPGSPAAEAGLRSGDRILSVQAPGAPVAPVRYFGDLRELVSPHAGEPLTFRVEREGATLEPLTIVPAPDEESNEDDEIDEDANSGVFNLSAFNEEAPSEEYSGSEDYEEGPDRVRAWADLADEPDTNMSMSAEVRPASGDRAPGSNRTGLRLTYC